MGGVNLATWQTAKTNWTTSDYYNYADLNRVENNTEYLRDYILTLGYYASIVSLVSNRTKESIVYADDMNRIESNIKVLADCSYIPLGWITPITNWVSVFKSFSYSDANRLESDLINLKTMVENIDAELKYCGAFTCGDDFNLGG